ncbi:TPA: acetyl-CoA carboxylase biotin carboxyl carrier protein subunit [Staphylococcus aureus]|uniref:acetyl-CoA carboxylase biotin carboxyl carrier protein n=1 Tax=Staphylococcus aureus TaxID=1280 RepID=UPI00005FE554|nr:biotin/lipoyl-containing protein [Staphylococcus aureus]MCE5060492.1 acetyl-CoA carboxylase biotin carboxyl carrier protein subunit [Staphylococcus aureus]CAI81167.1 biotin carboxyl carrier protein of acetyl-CoA carboxylase [Staphylococcus aureus RF122]SCT32356.1 Biotin carboxyl carrier protein; acetyl-CoA carboxylase [Staphylococcus aureus]SCT44204.1 Biotin carboxyl carrier protein; acetyl-CoA carboxylase [Staphylococcus aureus]SCT77484.1 Biotin carboxyl carrier protein; acetyl-CoA carboxy
MNIEKIEQIIKLVKENDVKKYKYKNFEDEIEIDFTDTNHLAAHNNQSNQSMNNNDLTASKANDNSDVSTNDYHDIKSPMVGTFFLQDSKELTEPIVKVGDKVNKGDIIGYVEAMKVLNEVTTDVAGEITEIVADHGTNVEYDQVLVRIK